jgi:hypothetical protein
MSPAKPAPTTTTVAFRIAGARLRAEAVPGTAAAAAPAAAPPISDLRVTRRATALR